MDDRFIGVVNSSAFCGFAGEDDCMQRSSTAAMLEGGDDRHTSYNTALKAQLCVGGSVFSGAYSDPAVGFSSRQPWMLPSTGFQGDSPLPSSTRPWGPSSDSQNSATAPSALLASSSSPQRYSIPPAYPSVSASGSTAGSLYTSPNRSLFPNPLQYSAGTAGRWSAAEDSPGALHSQDTTAVSLFADDDECSTPLKRSANDGPSGFDSNTTQVLLPSYYSSSLDVMSSPPPRTAHRYPLPVPQFNSPIKEETISPSNAFYTGTASGYYGSNSLSHDKFSPSPPPPPFQFNNALLSLTSTPSKPLRTPVRNENSLLTSSPSPSHGMLDAQYTPNRTHFGTPGRSSLSMQPLMPQSQMLKRPESTTALKVLDGSGLSHNYLAKPITYGSSCHLLAALQHVVFQWMPSSLSLLYEDGGGVEAAAVGSTNKLHASKHYAAIGLDNGMIHGFEFDVTGSVIGTFSIASLAQSRITSIAFNDHVMYCGATDGTFSVVDVQALVQGPNQPKPTDPASPESKVVLHKTELGGTIFCIDITDDGNHIAVATSVGIFVYHRSQTNWEPTTFEEGKSIRALSWAPSSLGLGVLVYNGGAFGTSLVVRSLSGGVRTTKETLTEIITIRCCRNTEEMIVSHGKVVHVGDAAGAAEPGLRMYDLSGQRIRSSMKLTGHGRDVTCMCLSPSGDILVTAGMDNSIRFWDLANPSLAPKHHEPHASSLGGGTTLRSANNGLSNNTGMLKALRELHVGASLSDEDNLGFR